MAFASNGWVIATVAFAIGVAVGWRLWGAPAANESDAQRTDQRDQPSDDVDSKSNLPDQEKLEALSVELATIRKHLTVDETDDEYIETLDELDEKIKRANGRFKLIAKALKK